MVSIKTVCHQLDETLEEFFSIKQELLSEQYQLEQRLKDAFFLMSKARYTMGVTSVTSLQYNENDLVEADVNVYVEGDSTFKLVTKKEQNSADRNNSVRKRDIATEETPQSLQTTQYSSNRVKIAEKDPIRWFGILVPQSLKQCQAHFRTATDVICTIATLKAQYTDCQKRYRELLEQKQMLLNESFEKLEIET